MNNKEIYGECSKCGQSLDDGHICPPVDYTEQFNQLNPVDALISDTDYYKFFDEVGYINDHTEAKTAYLADRFKFIRGEDKIGRNCTHIMNLIHARYYWDNVAPAKDDKYYDDLEAELDKLRTPVDGRGKEYKGVAVHDQNRIRKIRKILAARI